MSTGGDAAKEGDAHDPGRACQHNCFTSLTSAARVQVSTRQEYDGEDSVHEMEQLPRMQSEGETGKADQTLKSR